MAGDPNCLSAGPLLSVKLLERLYVMRAPFRGINGAAVITGSCCCIDSTDFYHSPTARESTSLDFKPQICRNQERAQCDLQHHFRLSCLSATRRLTNLGVTTAIASLSVEGRLERFRDTSMAELENLSTATSSVEAWRDRKRNSRGGKRCVFEVCTAPRRIRVPR